MGEKQEYYVDEDGYIIRNTDKFDVGEIKTPVDVQPLTRILNSHDALLDALKQAVCGNMGWKGIAEDVIAQAEKEG